MRQSGEGSPQGLPLLLEHLVGVEGHLVVEVLLRLGQRLVGGALARLHSRHARAAVRQGSAEAVTWTRVLRAAERIPVRRVGRPEDIANVVSFLVSEDASYVSGQTIYVAGGPKG